MGTARLDRAVLLLLGLLLTAAGALGLLAGSDLLGSRTGRTGVLDNAVGRLYGDQGVWLWPVTGVVGLLLGLLALRWLRAQLTPVRLGALELEPHSTTGRTAMPSVAVVERVLEEVRGYRGVTGASGRMRLEDTEPRLDLVVQVAARADVSTLRARIETEAVGHARQALDDDVLPVRLDLVVTGKQVRGV